MDLPRSQEPAAGDAGTPARAAEVRLRPYGDGDLDLLRRVLGEPDMTVYLGGPESPQAIEARHRRYASADPETNGLFVIVSGPVPEPVGWVGFWQAQWHDDPVWECGWNVVPESQGRGVATAAASQMIAAVRERRRHRYLLAFPNVDNAASNALCRTLGFELLGDEEFEFPKGHLMRCNAWRLDLR